MRIKIVLLSVLLASCDSFYIPFISPYKLDVRQGNFVTKEMREQLKLGMSKVQVRFVLGTPLIKDIFHANRWDYVYRFVHNDKIVEQQKLTLYFENENLARIEDGGQPAGSVPVKAEPQAKGQT
jgi:outer membrane protein assembly factor BamE